MRDWKDIGIRALKTFFQGFLGALAVTLPTSGYTVEVIKPILVGAVAAGISCVMNYTVQLLKEEE
jgi:hypothetical protein